jgi:hypothetical protein
LKLVSIFEQSLSKFELIAAEMWPVYRSKLAFFCVARSLSVYLS